MRKTKEKKYPKCKNGKFQNGYVRCEVSNSLRKLGKSCPCSRYEPTFFEKVKSFFRRGKSK